MGFNHQKQRSPGLKEQFLAECNRLRKNMQIDFVGIALQQSDGLTITWPFVSGNTTNKYKHITVRYGKGVAGKVISTGADLALESFPNRISGKPTEYPIMLAERLYSAYAIPINFKGMPKGALLAGMRSQIDWSKANINQMKQMTTEIEKLLPYYFQ
ncbi:GAF domain-containing protein [Virgibacillus halodenitrificans]|uniref:GAF domain-containing protein n=1 Tax=Virgibacillus halodenitrificans TaxID=1482 RepID=UPI002DBDF5A3|nr:GAF domain-containing protein [Virgibacillus halodenitrificans]MEC2159233.1 GAF domain-containing protein [Virgibacillus halodenitrificans]